MPARSAGAVSHGAVESGVAARAESLAGPRRQGSFGGSGRSVGAGLFAAIYHRLERGVIRVGHSGDLTLPKPVPTIRRVVALLLVALLVGLLVWTESAAVTPGRSLARGCSRW